MNLQMPGHVMRWVGPIAITIVGALLIFGNPISIDVLCTGTQNCISTWVGALSGWVAAIAAFFTIKTMTVTQRQNVDIQLQRDMTLARIVRRRCAADKKRLAVLSLLKQPSDLSTRTLTPEEMTAFRKLKRSFDQDDFDEFEKIEFVGATYLRSVRKGLLIVENTLKLYRMSSDGITTRHTIVDREFEIVSKTLTRAEEHNQRLTDAADRFISRWENQGVSF